MAVMKQEEADSGCSGDHGMVGLSALDCAALRDAAGILKLLSCACSGTSATQPQDAGITASPTLLAFELEKMGLASPERSLSLWIKRQ